MTSTMIIILSIASVYFIPMFLFLLLSYFFLKKITVNSIVVSAIPLVNLYSTIRGTGQLIKKWYNENKNVVLLNNKPGKAKKRTVPKPKKVINDNTITPPKPKPKPKKKVPEPL